MYVNKHVKIALYHTYYFQIRQNPRQNIVTFWITDVLNNFA